MRLAKQALTLVTVWFFYPVSLTGDDLVIIFISPLAVASRNTLTSVLLRSSVQSVKSLYVIQDDLERHNFAPSSAVHQPHDIRCIHSQQLLPGSSRVVALSSESQVPPLGAQAPRSPAEDGDACGRPADRVA